MSELQISLLAIGVVVVLALYGYSFWQQRQYQRRFGAAFAPLSEDALHQPLNAASPLPLAAEDLVATASPAPAARVYATDEVCGLVEDRSDYLIELLLDHPTSSEVLEPLWQLRFDFGKNVNVCGLNAATGTWEKVIADSPLAYSAFRLALQLANRSGAITEARLMSFRDVVREIAHNLGMEVVLPDVAEALQRAQQLDAFCASVDQMIGLNIVPSGERVFSGIEVARVAELHGFSLQSDGAFHLLDERGNTLFSLCNFDNVSFQHHTLPTLRINALTLLLDVPRVADSTQRFDEMAVLARDLAMGLRAALLDDNRTALGEAGISHIRSQVASIENNMLAGGITPGSAQARRLFS